jgi:hypothetical protein
MFQRTVTRILTIPLLLMSCLTVIQALPEKARAQKLILSPDLANAVEMKVKGRQGWQFNQVIRFGEFSTSKVKRGWTKGYDIAFTLRFQKASEKLSYTQMMPDGRQADVLAVSRFKSTEYELIKGFLSYPIEREYTFAGTIIPVDSPRQSWEFIVVDPEGSLVKNADCGKAQGADGEVIYIHGIQQMEGMPKWMMGAYFGFEFIKDGQTIAAVSTVNNGKVWMKEGLPADTKLVVASLTSALLLRHDMSEAISGR